MRRLVFAMTLAACSGVQSPPSPDVGFETRVLGAGPNVMGVVRVRDALRDPIYGPYFRRAFEKAGAAKNSAAAAFANSDEIDGACDVRPNAREKDYVCTVVVYGDLGDASTVMEDDDKPTFDSATRLASGATEWNIVSESEWRLFTTRGAWIFAHGQAIEHVRRDLAESASPPPRLDLERRALGAVSIRGSALDGRDYNRASLSGSERIITQSLDTAEMVIMPSSSGDVISRFWMNDTDAAKILEGEMLATMRPDARCDSGCKLIRAVVASAFVVERTGSFVSIRLHLPEAILRKLVE